MVAFSPKSEIHSRPEHLLIPLRDLRFVRDDKFAKPYHRLRPARASERAGPLLPAESKSGIQVSTGEAVYQFGSYQLEFFRSKIR